MTYRAFKDFENDEIALLLMGLRSVFVADQQKNHAALTRALENELSRRGVTLATGAPTK